MLERQWEKQDTKNYIETSYSKGSKSLPPRKQTGCTIRVFLSSCSTFGSLVFNKYTKLITSRNYRLRLVHKPSLKLSAPLKGFGYIRREGSDRKGSWVLEIASLTT